MSCASPASPTTGPDWASRLPAEARDADGLEAAHAARRLQRVHPRCAGEMRVRRRRARPVRATVVPATSTSRHAAVGVGHHEIVVCTVADRADDADSTPGNRLPIAGSTVELARSTAAIEAGSPGFTAPAPATYATEPSCEIVTNVRSAGTVIVDGAAGAALSRSGPYTSSEPVPERDEEPAVACGGDRDADGRRTARDRVLRRDAEVGWRSGR